MIIPLNLSFFYYYSLGGRNLNSSTVNMTNEIQETSKMSLTYQLLYILSNLGGLYTFLIFAIGTFLRPIVNKIFTFELLNHNHLVYKQVLSNTFIH